MTPAQAEILAQDAKDFQQHSSRYPMADEYQHDVLVRGVPFESKPAAATLRAERSRLRAAATERWQSAVGARLEYARDTNEPLLDFRAPGIHRWWLRIVHGRPRPASSLRTVTHLVICVGLPVVLGAIGAVRWSLPVAALVTFLAMAVLSLITQKFQLAYVAFLVSLAFVGGLLGSAANLRFGSGGEDGVSVATGSGAVILPLALIVVSGRAGLPFTATGGARRRQSWPDFLPPWARAAGTVLSIAPIAASLLWLGLRLYAERAQIDATIIVSYLCISPFLVAGAIIALSVVRCAWVGLAVLVRRISGAVREAASGSLDSTMIMDRREALPIARELDSLHDSVYGKDGGHSIVTAAGT